MEIYEIEPAAGELKEPSSGGITKKGWIELLFAIFAFAAAYVFVSLVPISKTPIGFTVLTVCFYAVTLSASLLFGAKPDVFSFIAIGAAVCVSLFRVINGTSSYDLFPVFTVSGIIYAYFCVSLFGNHSRTVGGRFLLDIIKGIVYLFISFAGFFTAIFKPEGAKKSPKKILIIVVGVIIALILVIIVCSLLSYDEHFSELLPKFELEEVFDFFAKLFFAVPIGAMIMSLVLSSRDKKLPKLSSESSGENVGRKVKVIPSLLVALPIIAVLAVYVLFFVSQWAYYMSAFTKLLPKGYSAAEYAREGFFQLCAVAVINSVLILLIASFTKITGKAGEIVCKVLTVLLCAATLALIATALSKMFLYIDMYDLTRDRLAVTVFLVFLSVAFIAVILATLIRRVKALPVICATALVFLIAASLFNVNRYIANYNVDMYLSGKHKNIDLEYIASDLGWESVPALDRIKNEATDGTVKAKAAEKLTALADEMRSDDAAWYEKSIPYYRAKSILSNGGSSSVD